MITVQVIPNAMSEPLGFLWYLLPILVRLRRTSKTSHVNHVTGEWHSSFSAHCTRVAINISCEAALRTHSPLRAFREHSTRTALQSTRRWQKTCQEWWEINHHDGVIERWENRYIARCLLARSYSDQFVFIIKSIYLYSKHSNRSPCTRSVRRRCLVFCPPATSSELAVLNSSSCICILCSEGRRTCSWPHAKNFKSAWSKRSESRINK